MEAAANFFHGLSGFVPIVITLILLFLTVYMFKWVLRIFGIVMISKNTIGIVNKKFALLGKTKLPDGTLIALNKEAGIQADTLAPGVHFWLWPWQYEINMQSFITVPVGKIGIVHARDGKSISGGRVLAKHVECDSFQNARRFLEGDGERGPQISIIPPGTFRINTSLFDVEFESVTEISDNMVGIVTTKEGIPLRSGEIAGKEIAGHNMFQDGQAFLSKGGFKGLQEQVILAGRYFINPSFATVDIKPMTEVPIANVGVVIAYVGDEGEDVTGETFKHGNLVKSGQKGVWVNPLDPGKYPINPYTHKVECVSTANIVLNWATGKNEAHNLDKELSTITVRSFDGFTFNLDVSQIIHIPRNDATKVIARFGSVANLVTQVLEPTIGNYFRNTAQSSDAIDFLKKRQERQSEAKESIGDALQEYNVCGVDTLIGDINPPDELMKTLTDRKIAEQEKITFGTQREAQEQRQNLEQSKALADTQKKVVDSEREVAIAEFKANAKIKQAKGDAESKTINAEADAKVLITVGEAQGQNIKAIGSAEADVVRMKTEAMGQGNFALVEVGRALAKAGVPLVPQIMSGGGSGDGKGNTLVDVLLANIIQDDLNKKKSAPVKQLTVPEKPADGKSSEMEQSVSEDLKEDSAMEPTPEPNHKE